jgi:hypothetical protein
MQEADIETVSARHSGYNRIGCTHIRTVEFDRVKEMFTITDEVITDSKSHQIFQIWHLHPQASLEKLDKNSFIIKHSQGERKLKIQFDQQLNLSVVKGKINPLFGWYSKSFLCKEPTHVISGYIGTNFQQNIICKTLLQIL